jgi:hypothetical protein
MKIHTKRNVGLSLVASVFIIMIVINLNLESWVKDYLNNQINNLRGYSGKIKSIDIHLWRGAYQINNLILQKEKGGLKEPFIKIDKVDLSIQWDALFKGKVVSEIDLYNPDLKFAKSQTGKGPDWLTFVKALTPFDINRFQIHSGKVSYIDWTADPNINIYINNLNANITNISNVINRSVLLPSEISITGSTVGNGKLNIDGKMNALSSIPDFDLAIKVESADLTYFNTYFKEFAALNFEKGEISIYGEMASMEGKVIGYVKPIATNIKFKSLKNDNNILKDIWKSIASLFVDTFKNDEKNQFALRIPFKGQLKDPKENFWAGFWSIFSNAFNEAFKKDVDGNINLKDILENNELAAGDISRH